MTTELSNAKTATANEDASADSLEGFAALGFDQQDLRKLATWRMPFGIYSGRILIDLPEEYLFWFTRHGFPEGKLGKLMQLCLELKVEGLDALIKPLKGSAEESI